MTAYYNEIDPYAAQWLRNLISAGHISPGVVDERSIEDVCPDELMGYTQCHFFAGIGVWSLALRRAGWPDHRPVWTGSCPCQPFSQAGAGAGFADERHLWPHFRWVIEQCRPAVVFGEQVASKAAEPWIDLVHADLEALGYAFGAIPFPSAGVGAPHIRDRLYWVADASGAGLAKRERIKRVLGGAPCSKPRQALERGSLCAACGLAHHDGDRCQSGREGCAALEHGQATGADRGAFRLADNLMQQRPDGKPGIWNVNDAAGRIESAATPSGLCGDMRPGPTNGFWRDADWLGCRDDKWRPVEPGTFPLANGTASRVGRLRAYGNAINAEAATQFIAAYMGEI